MKKNNIILSVLFGFFPGLMRLISVFPRCYYLSIGIVSILVMIALGVFRRTKKEWIYCLPVCIISFAIWIGYSSISGDESIDFSKVTFSDQYTVSPELYSRADEGDVDAQLQIAEGLLLQHQAKGGGYIVTEYSDLPDILYYATLAAEQGSPKGYFILGLSNLSGLSGPRKVNHAISDFQKAIEIDPNYEDAFVGLLNIDSLKYSHPTVYTKYYTLYQELLEKRNRLRNTILDSLSFYNDTSVTNEVINSYLIRNDADVRSIISKDRFVLVNLLALLHFKNNDDVMLNYRDYYVGDRELNTWTIKAHLKDWSLSPRSRNIDSLITMLPIELLDNLIDPQDPRFDVYLKASVRNEAAYQKYIYNKCTTEYYDSVINYSSRLIDKHLKSIKPSISKKNWKSAISNLSPDVTVTFDF